MYSIHVHVTLTYSGPYPKQYQPFTSHKYVLLGHHMCYLAMDVSIISIIGNIAFYDNSFRLMLLSKLHSCVTDPAQGSLTTISDLVSH